MDLVEWRAQVALHRTRETGVSRFSESVFRSEAQHFGSVIVVNYPMRCYFLSSHATLVVFQVECGRGGRGLGARGAQRESLEHALHTGRQLHRGGLLGCNIWVRSVYLYDILYLVSEILQVFYCSSVGLI